VGREQPRPQFLERDVRTPRHLGGDRGMMVLELERPPIALRPGLGLAGRRTAGKGFVDVGRANLATALAGLPASLAASTRDRRSVE
jgi:hypothetical protein